MAPTGVAVRAEAGELAEGPASVRPGEGYATQPGQVGMQPGHAAVQPNQMARELAGRTELVIKQARKGCLQECCGCEATSMFRIFEPGHQAEPLFFVLEESSFLLRLCCASIRPWTTTLSLGGERGGEPIVTYDRPLRCNPGPMKCCCYQTVTATDVRTGTRLGSVRETLFCCVPRLALLDRSGATTHMIHQPTWCCGTCVVICSRDGGGCCKVPFYLYPVVGGAEQNEPVGKIIKVWGGLKRELLTDADTFQLSAPHGSASEEIATLIGATLLINELFFETYNEGEGKEGASPTSML